MSSEHKSIEQPKRIDFDNPRADKLLAKIPTIFKDPTVAEECLDMLLSINKPESEELQAKMADARDRYQEIRQDTSSEETYITLLIRLTLKAYTTTDIEEFKSFFCDMFTDRHPTNGVQSYIERCILLFISLGVDINNIDDEECTALHYAAKCENVETIPFLAKLGNDVNAKDTYGHTPLGAAVIHGHIASIKALIDQKANIKDIDYDGMTLLHLAAKYGQAEAIRFLVQQGSNINAKDEDGSTPFDCAINSQRIVNADCVRALLEAGADVNVADSWGRTPLCDAAATANAYDKIRVLLEYKADVNVKTNRGQSPLELAINNLDHQAAEAIHLLLAQGAEIGDLHTRLEKELHKPSHKKRALNILADYIEAPRTEVMQKIDNYINARNKKIVAELPSILKEILIPPLIQIVADYVPLDDKEAKPNNEPVQRIQRKEWVKKTLIALTEIISYDILLKPEMESKKDSVIAQLKDTEHWNRYEAYWDRLQTAREKGEDLYKVAPPDDMYKILPIAIKKTPAPSESKESRVEAQQTSPANFSGSFLAFPSTHNEVETPVAPPKQSSGPIAQEAPKEQPGQETSSSQTTSGPGFSSSEG